MSEETPTSEQPFTVVTLDGGAATGKSSTASGVARKLGFLHVDTGSHYRAVTFLLLARGVSPAEGSSLDETLGGLDLSASVEDTEATLLADGVAVASADLRSEEVNQAVSAFAALPPVRRRLLRYQRWFREIAEQKGFAGLIMEGRDIGSVVFPDATFRFFLEADSATRVKRRSEEGQSDSVVERDRADSGRRVAPLLCPEGAIRIDTGNLSLEKVIDRICREIGEGKPKRLLR